MSEEKELPSPRFELVSKMFDEIDEILAKNDQESHLSIFEMEILVLMIRKKVEHLGMMTALQMSDEESTQAEEKKSPDVYR